ADPDYRHRTKLLAVESLAGIRRRRAAGDRGASCEHEFPRRRAATGAERTNLENRSSCGSRVRAAAVEDASLDTVAAGARLVDRRSRVPRPFQRRTGRAHMAAESAALNHLRVRRVARAQ